VPENGHCFILLAPHIGLSKRGVFGQYNRAGQSTAGAACGAAIGAYQKCCQERKQQQQQRNKSSRDGEPLVDENDDDDDQQFAYICQEVGKTLSSIDGGEEKDHDDNDNKKSTENAIQVALVQRMHDMAKTMLDKIVSLHFGGDHSKLVVLTGIQINMPHPFNDYFQPLSFTVRHKDGSVDDQLAKVFFGH
jgi:hypothetical protein